MKITSITEREFVKAILNKNKRLDGRNSEEGRTLNLKFFKAWGGCIVYLGNTSVLAQVSAEITEPKAASSTEGALHVNFELSPMSAPDINISRTSTEFIELQRSLERCIRDSKCIDLESLCIVAGVKVWTIRVDLHALNDDGNVLECASIAGIAALAHFKRSDVTVMGTDVTVHSLDDREPVPLNLHHMPISIQLAIFNNGSHILVDPTEAEERIADGCYIIGMNAHQEICFVHRRGCLLLPEDIIQKCEGIAIRRAQLVTQAIRSAIDDDAYKRATKAPIGLINMLQTGTILSDLQPIYNFDINSIAVQKNEVEVFDVDNGPEIVSMEEDTPSTSAVTVSAAKERAIQILKDGEATIFEGGVSKWGTESEEEESDTEEEPSKPLKDISVKQEMELENESSEEETGFIESDQVDVKPSASRGWYSKSPFI